MIFPQLTWLTNVVLLCLRLMVGAVFFTSGWRHLKDPAGRSKDIGMSVGFTIFLGAAELVGALGVISGVLIQPAALGLILVMGARFKRKSSCGKRDSGEAQEQTVGVTISCSW